MLLAPTRLIISAVSSGAISRSVPEARAPAEQRVGPQALHQRRGLEDHAVEEQVTITIGIDFTPIR